MRLPGSRACLLRRHEPEIPAALVRTVPSFDVALRIEARMAASHPRIARALARWRTDQFDRRLARTVGRSRLGAVLLFSDVGSEATLPLCRRLGIPSIVSMVHGDVRDEERVMETESAIAPEFMGMYLGGGSLDSKLLAWLHERRLRDLALADRILVPSDHIAHRLIEQGTPLDKLHVIPYAADCRRFGPGSEKRDARHLHVSVCGGDQPAQGNQIFARSLATDPPPWLAAPTFGPLAEQPRATRALPRIGRAAGTGFARGNARADAGSRRLCVSITL